MTMEEVFVDWLAERSDKGLLTESDIIIALKSPGKAQELWNEFAHQDWAYWVQNRIRSFFPISPNIESIGSGYSIDDEQHCFFKLSPDNTMVSKIGISNCK